MGRGWFVGALLLLSSASVRAQLLDVQVQDAGSQDAASPAPADGGLDAGARDGGAVSDAGSGPLDLDLPEQGCQLAARGSQSGLALALFALLSMRRRRRT